MGLEPEACYRERRIPGCDDSRQNRNGIPEETAIPKVREVVPVYLCTRDVFSSFSPGHHAGRLKLAVGRGCRFHGRVTVCEVS